MAIPLARNAADVVWAVISLQFAATLWGRTKGLWAVM